MAGPHKKTPDPDELKGLTRAMKGAFAPNSPVDPELVKLIRKVDGKYVPDEAADERAGNLLDRLKNLSWGDGHQGAHV